MCVCVQRWCVDSKRKYPFFKKEHALVIYNYMRFRAFSSIAVCLTSFLSLLSSLFLGAREKTSVEVVHLSRHHFSGD